MRSGLSVGAVPNLRDAVLRWDVFPAAVDHRSRDKHGAAVPATIVLALGGSGDEGCDGNGRDGSDGEDSLADHGVTPGSCWMQSHILTVSRADAPMGLRAHPRSLDS